MELSLSLRCLMSVSGGETVSRRTFTIDGEPGSFLSRSYFILVSCDGIEEVSRDAQMSSTEAFK